MKMNPIKITSVLDIDNYLKDRIDHLKQQQSTGKWGDLSGEFDWKKDAKLHELERLRELIRISTLGDLK